MRHAGRGEQGEPAATNTHLTRPLAPSLSLTPGQASLLQEMSKLNLSRFVEEVAGSVAEARLKLTDLPAALQACRRYREI